MNRLTARQKRTLKRLINLDPYLVKKFQRQFEDKAERFFERYFFGRRRRVAENSVIAKFLDREIRQPLGLELFFDIEYYSAVARKPFSSIESAVAHYNSNVAERIYLNTHPLFDASYYMKQIADLGGLSPLAHYLDHIDEFPERLPTPYFDRKFYIQSYADVADSSIDPFIHFMRFGRFELRKPHPLVDPEYILASNPQLLQLRLDPFCYYLTSSSNQASAHPLLHPFYIRRQVKERKLPLGNGEPLLLYIRYGESQHVNPHPLFDGDYYRTVLLNSVLPPLESSESLLAHFLRNCRVDAPIDPSTAFSVTQYWYNNPDIGTMNPLYHYVRYGKGEQREIGFARQDLSDPSIQAVLNIEPAIVAPHQNINKMFSTIYPNFYHPGYSLIRGLIKDIGSFEPDTIFLFSAFRRGGAERYVLKIVEAILDKDLHGRVLIMLTDRATDEADRWCPRHASLRVTSFMHEPDLPETEAVNVLARVLEMLRPRQVINCNSRIGWEVFQQYGPPLSTITKLRACLFTYDYDTFGTKVGYARDYVRDSIAHLDIVIIDNEKFLRNLVDDFSLVKAEAAKLKVVYQLLDGAHLPNPINDWPDLAKNVLKPRFIWPMRFHRQKRPDLLRNLALQMPHIQIDAWVPGGAWNSEVARGGKPSNVSMIADANQKFFDLNLAPYCGMLSTAQWDGLPTIILEGIEAGLPIVSSNVGGVSEAVPAEAGYLVTPYDSLDGYEQEIRRLLMDPAEADRRRKRAYSHVSKQHSRSAYLRRLNELGILQWETPE